MSSTNLSRFRRRLDVLSRLEELDNCLRRIERENVIQENILREIRTRRGVMWLSELRDEECLILFRFTYSQIKELVVAFGFSETFTIRPDDDKHRKSIPTEEALAITLRRLAFPARLDDLSYIFGHSKYDISRIFNAMIKQLYDKCGRLMDLNYNQFSPVNLGRFSWAIHAAGSVYPSCVGFIDGTFMRCARPIDDSNQRILYNGHYRGHGFKFQAIVTPDGITSSLWGPITGNRHDAHMYEESRMEERLTPLFDLRENNGRCYHLYGDAAYASSMIMERPYNRVTANAEQLCRNKQMSSVRICVENEFAHVTNLFSYLDFKRTLRSGSSPITQTSIVATFLKNVHVCINGRNQTSDRFKVLPPTLNAYLNGFNPPQTRQQ